MRKQQQRRESVKGVLAGAVITTVATMCASPAQAVVQDYNNARGFDGYQVTHPGNGFYFATGTFDGRQFQPTPTGPPGASGEFFFAGSDGGYVLDVRAPLGQGATWDQSVNLAAGDNGGYMHMDYFNTGTAGYPPPLDAMGNPLPPPYGTPGSFWFGGAGNDAGPLPSDPNNPNYGQLLAYADVLAPAGKKFEFRIESDFTFQGNGFKFIGTGTGGWQTVGGTFSSALPFGSFDTFDPQLAMLVAFGTPGAGTTELSWDGGGAFGSTPAVIRWDNLTVTTAISTWTAASGGSWTSNSNWSTFAPSGRNAAAIFGPSANPQTITLDTPVVAANEDFPYQNAFYVGSLELNSAASYTIAGGEPLIIDTTAANGVDLSGPQGQVTVLAGAHTISAPLKLNRTTEFNVASATSLLVTSDQVAAQAAGIIKTGTGNLEMKHARANSLAVNAGLLKITPTGGLATGTSYVGSVAVTSGKLDLTDNKLLTNSPAGSATAGVYNGVQGLVQSGQNGGTWDGNGIITSRPDALNSLTSIGVATGAQLRGLGPTDTDFFAGQTIYGITTVAMYTYAGDANLDGKIDPDDFANITFNDNDPTAQGWFNGDFNYDSEINADDFALITFNFNAQGAPFPTSGADLASQVPEPAACAFAGAAVLLLARRRRV